MDKQRQLKTFNKQAQTLSQKQTQGAWRRRLLRDASGEILELGVGTGANFPFYPAFTRLTAVDFSPKMLGAAKATATESGMGNIRWLEADVDTLELADQSFDTIVSTLSLCSYEDPQSVLQKMNRWCKPTGRILLLEHGVSANRLLSFAQRVAEPIACRISGCHHTRDIVREVHASGLTIEHIETYWFGMMHLIWARPVCSQSNA